MSLEPSLKRRSRVDKEEEEEEETGLFFNMINLLLLQFECFELRNLYSEQGNFNFKTIVFIDLE